MTAFSLAHLTFLDLPPPELVSLAARAGFDAVGVRMIAVTPTTPGYDLARDRSMMRETKRRMADTGLRVSDIEFVKITPEIDVAAHRAFLEAGAELGATNAIVAPYDPDLGRMSERIAAFCDLAAPLGIAVSLEFFPWTVVPNLATAVEVLRRLDRSNSGILVDVLHFDRSDSTLTEFDGVPPHWLRFAHLCDARGPRPTTAEGLIFTAREDRLPPGEGEIDLPLILSHMPAGIPVGVEVPAQGVTPEGRDAFARRCREGAGRAVERARFLRETAGPAASGAAG